MDTRGWDWKDDIYTILVEEVGAPEGQREMFWHTWPQCIEYRFMGSLGFGGKVWHDRYHERVYVNCYREDETPERLALIEKANARLAECFPSRPASVPAKGTDDG